MIEPEFPSFSHHRRQTFISKLSSRLAARLIPTLCPSHHFLSGYEREMLSSALVLMFAPQRMQTKESSHSAYSRGNVE